MTDSMPTTVPIPFQGSEVSGAIDDLLAIPEIVDQLPDWVRVPLCRFVRLRQRNWPAKSVKRSTSLLCRHLTAMIQYLNEEGCCQGWTDWSVRLIEAYIDDKLRYGWAPATVNLDLSPFRSFCWFAIGEGYPVPHILTRIKRLDIPKRLPRPLTDEQVESLEACIQEAISQAEREFHRKVAIRDLACLYLMWHCGLRVSEVSSLLVSDVDLSGRKLFIQHSKEGKDRMLYISQTTAESIREHLANRRRPDSPCAVRQTADGLSALYTISIGRPKSRRHPPAGASLTCSPTVKWYSLSEVENGLSRQFRRRRQTRTGYDQKATKQKPDSCGCGTWRDRLDPLSLDCLLRFR